MDFSSAFGIIPYTTAFKIQYLIVVFKQLILTLDLTHGHWNCFVLGVRPLGQGRRHLVGGQGEYIESS